MQKWLTYCSFCRLKSRITAAHFNVFVRSRCSSHPIHKIRHTSPFLGHVCDITTVHYPSWRSELTGVKKMHPSSRAVNSARELGPWTWVVETGLYILFTLPSAIQQTAVVVTPWNTTVNIVIMLSPIYMFNGVSRRMIDMAFIGKLSCNFHIVCHRRE